MTKKKEDTPIEEKQPEKVYSYKKMNSKMVWKQHTFKESEIDEQGFIHFYKQIAEAYNKAPFAVKAQFMSTAGPQFQAYMEKEETQAAVAAGLAIENGASDMKIIN